MRNGNIKVTMEGLDSVRKRLDKIDGGMEKAISRTVGDVAKRAPGWISKGVRAHYGVDAAAIKEAQGAPKRGGFRTEISGTPVDGIQITYRGRTLTPLHFHMTPGEAPRERQDSYNRVSFEGGRFRMVHPVKPYGIKATIIKGKRAALSTGQTGSKVYLAPAQGGQIMPFIKRSGKGPEVMRTISVPQMIDGRAREDIRKNIDEGTKKRFENAIRQATKGL